MVDCYGLQDSGHFWTYKKQPQLNWMPSLQEQPFVSRKLEWQPMLALNMSKPAAFFMGCFWCDECQQDSSLEDGKFEVSWPSSLVKAFHPYFGTRWLKPYPRVEKGIWQRQDLILRMPDDVESPDEASSSHSPGPICTWLRWSDLYLAWFNSLKFVGDPPIKP